MAGITKRLIGAFGSAGDSVGTRGTSVNCTTGKGALVAVDAGTVVLVDDAAGTAVLVEVDGDGGTLVGVFDAGNVAGFATAGTSDALAATGAVAIGSTRVDVLSGGTTATSAGGFGTSVASISTIAGWALAVTFISIVSVTKKVGMAIARAMPGNRMNLRTLERDVPRPEDIRSGRRVRAAPPGIASD